MLLRRVRQILGLLSVRCVNGWVQQLSSRPPSLTYDGSTRRLLTRLLESRSTKDVLGGVSEFEKWFSSLPNAFSAVKHKNFGSLRGLTCFTDGEGVTDKTIVLSVPQEVILKAPYSSNPDWDVQLAQQLWDECQKGEKSKLYCYCSLLACGTQLPISDGSCPPSTSPNALRHWKEAELAVLQSNAAGKRVLKLNAEQQQQWRKKYQQAKNMEFEQFQWVMEAVHSRAFKGEFSSSGGSISVASAAAPVLAAIAGWTYLNDNAAPSDIILLGLGFLAGAPTLWSVVSPKSVVAVLLPFIDSANHLESANSSIEYDPVKHTVSLGIARDCLVDEKDGKQLYVSYGSKTDSELLINYGFVPDGEQSNNEKGLRQTLAKSFLQRCT